MTTGLGEQMAAILEGDDGAGLLACVTCGAPAPVEMSPDFTDTSRAALLWVLWHHQGGSSPIGQPLRFALGMGQHEHLNASQIAEAKRWAALTNSTTPEFHKGIPPAPPLLTLPDDLIDAKWRELCDSRKYPITRDLIRAMARAVLAAAQEPRQ